MQLNGFFPTPKTFLTTFRYHSGCHQPSAREFIMYRKIAMCLEDGLNKFLEVTTIHGFCYLASSQGFVTRVAWARLSSFILCFFFKDSSFNIILHFQLSMLVVCFSICYLLISRLLVFWAANPVLITVCSTHAQVSELVFPTITVCPEEFSLPDLWGAGEPIFNSANFACDGQGHDVDKEGCGTKAREVRSDLRWLFYKLATEKIDEFRKNDQLDIFASASLTVKGQMEDYTKKLADIVSSTASLDFLDSQIKTELSSKILTEESADAYLHQTITQLLHGNISTVGNNVTKEAFDYARAIVSSAFAFLGEGEMENLVPYGTFMKHFYQRYSSIATSLVTRLQTVVTLLQRGEET